MAFSFQPRATTICLPLFFSRPPNRPPPLSLATMSNSSPAGFKDHGTSAHKSRFQTSDLLQQTVVIFQKRPQKKRTPSKPRQGRWALPLMRPWKQPHRRVEWQAEAEGETLNIIPRCCGCRQGKQRSRQWHALENRSAWRACENGDNSGGVAGDHGRRLPLFELLLECQEETQRNLDELSAHLCQTRSTQKETRRAKKDKHMHPPERTRGTIFCPSMSGEARRPASSQLTLRVVSPSETKPRLKGPGRSGVDPTRGRDTHRCPRSKCRSAGRRCFAAVFFFASSGARWVGQ